MCSFVNDLLAWGIATPAVYTALTENLENVEEIISLVYTLKEQTRENGFTRFKTERCIVAICQSANYFNDSYVLLSKLNESNLLDHDKFVKLCEYHVKTKGMIRNVLYALHVTGDQNLLTSDNFEKLSAILPYVKTVNAALSALDFKDKLSQSAFNEIIMVPINALFITARYLKIPQLRRIAKSREFNRNYPDAGAAIQTFIDVGSASRYLYGPLFRAQHHALQISPSLPPDEILHKISTHIGDNGTLEDKTIQHTMRICRSE
jgi:hypothetical protein